MKIGFTGLDIPEGKIKYKDEKLIALEQKCQPKKVSPFFVEFLKDEYIQSAAIAVHKDKLLDILIVDIEKLETRIANTDSANEKELCKKCISYLEKEVSLCDVDFNEEEQKLLQGLSPISIKPTAVFEAQGDIDAIIKNVLDKSQMTFFYTAGKQEVHAWLIKKSSNIVTCAEKIHSDLARGFIKADIISFDDYMKCHGMTDAATKGLVKVVGRDYAIGDSEIIEIRFNV